MPSSLKDKTILITGGTSELGHAFVLKALGAGARVFFTYFKNNVRAQTLREKGAVGFILDLADTAAIDRFAKTFKTEVKTLDVLIHNAAAVRDHTIQNLTEEEWDHVIAVDLKAPYYLTKKVMPLLFKEAETPKKIFMITSRAALQGGIGISNYAAAKAGLIGLTKSLAQELGKKRILVNAVNPGFMKSAMTAELPPEILKKNRDASPLDQISNPEEVAVFLISLSSDEMTQVTGQIFHFESRKT